MRRPRSRYPYWLVGIAAILALVTNLGTASAAPVPYSLTLSSNGQSLSFTGADAPGSAVTGNAVGGWFADVYFPAVSVPDLVSMQVFAQNSSATKNLDVNFSANVSGLDPALGQVIHVSDVGGYQTGSITFVTTAGNQTVQLGPYNTGFDYTADLNAIGSTVEQVIIDLTIGSDTPLGQINLVSETVGLATPEPGTLLLLASGMLGFIGVGARRWS
jgi:hypothetical protein